MIGNSTSSGRTVPASIWLMSSSVFSMPDMARSVSSRRVTSARASSLLVVADLRQDTLHQAEGLQRLAEVVAGGGKEAGLRDIGLLGFPLGGLQRVGGVSPFGDVGKGDDDAFDSVILGAVGQDAADVPERRPAPGSPARSARVFAALSERRSAERYRRPAN